MSTSVHWSNEPGRWTATLKPEAWATIPRIQAPSLSPDSSKVAYIRGYDGRNDVWVVDVEGGLPLQLTDAVTPQGPDPNQRQATPLAWTPDSKHIIFASNDGGKLYKVPADGGATERIEEAAGNHHSPAVSPDGARIAFVAERGETVDIFVVSADGTLLRQMSSPSDDGFVANPRWSPGGGQLMWTRWPHYDMPWDETSIFVTDSTQGPATEISGGDRVVNNWAQWSPDGEWIAFMSDRGREHPNLWRMRPDGSDREALVTEDNDHLRPVWSPDSKKIAYLRSADCEHQIRVWDNGDTVQVTDEPGVHSDLAWINDEELICVYESPCQPPDLFVIGLDGSRRRLTQSATGAVIGGGLTLPEVIDWQSTDGLSVSGMLFEPDEIIPGKRTRSWCTSMAVRSGRHRRTGRPGSSSLSSRATSSSSRTTGDRRATAGRSWKSSTGTGAAAIWTTTSAAPRVIKRGAVDPGRVVATGGSAGGYSTLICMTKALNSSRPASPASVSAI
ncbi:MAG: LpqB family beta-propeller domain-containing protein [Thermomicrobiales bacterium]